MNRNIKIGQSDNSSELVDDGVSPIWDSLRRDFHGLNSSLRGYGMSGIHYQRVRSFQKLNALMCLPFEVLVYASSGLKKFTNRALSLIFFGDTLAASKYGFLRYKPEIYDREGLNDFERRYSKHNIGFSHNTFKAYSYLKRIESYLPLNKKLYIFEIGAGVFNFGHLLSLRVNSFHYVICDLPEMITTACTEIKVRYKPYYSGDYEIYGPTEIEEFKKSTSSRKVLFITPQQLKKGCLGSEQKFDLFINHESFSEMKIDTVNMYLRQVSELMDEGALVNLVNRHSRPQAKSNDQFKSLEITDITCFSDYSLGFCAPTIMTVDTFRASIPEQQKMPNVFFLGRVEKMRSDRKAFRSG